MIWQNEENLLNLPKVYNFRDNCFTKSQTRFCTFASNLKQNEDEKSIFNVNRHDVAVRFADGTRGISRQNAHGIYLVSPVAHGGLDYRLSSIRMSQRS